MSVARADDAEKPRPRNRQQQVVWGEAVEHAEAVPRHVEGPVMVDEPLPALAADDRAESEIAVARLIVRRRAWRERAGFERHLGVTSGHGTLTACRSSNACSPTTPPGRPACWSTTPVSSPACRNSRSPSISGSAARTAACRPTRSSACCPASCSSTATSPTSSCTPTSTASRCMQFAVDVLEGAARHRCGHYGCGGVRRRCDGERLGLIDNWLRHVQDVRAEARASCSTAAAGGRGRSIGSAS